MNDLPIRPANPDEFAELTTSIRLAFWALTLFVAYFVTCIVWMALDPLGGWAARLMAILLGGIFVLMLVISILAAYRLSRALGYKIAVRIVYCVLMLLPIGNFILLWNLRDRGTQLKPELRYRQLADGASAAGTPARPLSELVAEAVSKPEPNAAHRRFARSTLMTLAASTVLSGILLVIAFRARDDYDRLMAAMLAIIPCVAFVSALIKLAIEACSASTQDRTTPVKAVEAYRR
jgi:sorbitol-specific phosphotransferase system component IIBC